MLASNPPGRPSNPPPDAGRRANGEQLIPAFRLVLAPHLRVRDMHKAGLISICLLGPPQRLRALVPPRCFAPCGRFLFGRVL